MRWFEQRWCVRTILKQYNFLRVFEAIMQKCIEKYNFNFKNKSLINFEKNIIIKCTFEID